MASGNICDRKLNLNNVIKRISDNLLKKNEVHKNFVRHTRCDCKVPMNEQKERERKNENEMNKPPSTRPRNENDLGRYGLNARSVKKEMGQEKGAMPTIPPQSVGPGDALTRLLAD